MQRAVLIFALSALLVPLSGCFGGGFDFEPGTGYKETGRTVHIRMWVEDMVESQVYPGLELNFWAFCAEPANPNDEYSRDAIEYREPTGVVQRLQSDNTFVKDEETTKKCSVPGPQLRVQQGDRVIVDFLNPHFHPHTIHWHGQFVPWESDGAQGASQDTVAPNGGEFRYEFIAKRAGTLWYHCHVDTQLHVNQGLYGVIIVEPQEDKYEPKDIDKEYTLVLATASRKLMENNPFVTDPHAQHKHGGTCGASGFPNCQNPPMTEPSDVFMINARSFPDTMHSDETLVRIAEGERVRLRLVNAGDTFETMHPHGHDMYVTHRDGNPLEAPFWVDTLTIGPAERYDVVIEGNNPGLWMFHTHVATHETNDGQSPGGMHTMIVYDGFEEFMHTFLAELPGGQPFRTPVTIPEDYRDVINLALADGNDAELGAWPFPVSQPCAVKAVTVEGTLVPGNPITGALGQVRAALVDPDGAEIDNAQLSSLPGGEDAFRFFINETSQPLSVAGLLDGDHQVRLTGTSLDMRIALSVLVDYYADMAAADAGATTYGRPLCGVVT